MADHRVNIQAGIRRVSGGHQAGIGRHHDGVVTSPVAPFSYRNYAADRPCHLGKRKHAPHRGMGQAYRMLMGGVSMVCIGEHRVTISGACRYSKFTGYPLAQLEHDNDLVDNGRDGG